MQGWFDTHVHLDRYSPEERSSILQRAAEAEVAVIGVAVDVDSAAGLSAIEGMCGYTVGVHPRHAGSAGPKLAEIARAAGVLAIGECGFDRPGEDRGLQARLFVEQCGLAHSLRLPLVLHIDGPGAFEALVANSDAMDGLVTVRHYFTGDAAEAAWHRERGHYLSFGNPLRRSSALRELARDYPAERLLIETDSYPLPGRNTEPRDLRLIGETLALVRDWTFEEARERLAENTLNAFRKLRRS